MAVLQDRFPELISETDSQNCFLRLLSKTVFQGCTPIPGSSLHDIASPLATSVRIQGVTQSQDFSEQSALRRDSPICLRRPSGRVWAIQPLWA